MPPWGGSTLAAAPRRRSPSVSPGSPRSRRPAACRRTCSRRSSRRWGPAMTALPHPGRHTDGHVHRHQRSAQPGVIEEETGVSQHRTEHIDHGAQDGHPDNHGQHHLDEVPHQVVSLPPAICLTCGAQCGRRQVIATTSNHWHVASTIEAQPMRSVKAPDHVPYRGQGPAGGTVSVAQDQRRRARRRRGKAEVTAIHRRARIIAAPCRVPERRPVSRRFAPVIAAGVALSSYCRPIRGPAGQRRGCRPPEPAGYRFRDRRPRCSLPRRPGGGWSRPGSRDGPPRR